MQSADPGVQQEAAAEDAVGSEAGQRLDDAAAADDQRAVRQERHRVREPAACCLLAQPNSADVQWVKSVSAFMCKRGSLKASGAHILDTNEQRFCMIDSFALMCS